MATESPIRISEGTNRWRMLKQSTRYNRPSSAEMAIEGLGLFLKDQRCQSLEKDVIPSRSESAPPSIEGSIAALENILPHRISALYRGNCADGSLGLPKNSLTAHEEESEDDRSSEQSASVSVEKAGLSGYHSLSLDSTQNASQASSPSHDQNFSSSYKPMKKKVDSDGHAHVLHNSYVNISSAGAGNVDSAHIEVVKSVNVFSGSNSDPHKHHKKEQWTPQNNVPQQQASPQEYSTSRVQESYPQIIYPRNSHAYGGLNQFNHNSSSVSTAEIQPTLQSSGFAPPLYASAAAYMPSLGPFYHNLPPAGIFALQYNTGGYNLNSAVLPSYVAGYPHVPIPGVSNGYDPQNQFKFYGRVGVPLQPPFHMQYVQPPLRDFNGSCINFDHRTPRDGAAGGSQVSSYDSKKGAEFVGLSNDYKPQHLAGAGYNDLNLRSGNMSSNYYFGSPTNGGPLSLSHSSGVNASQTNGLSQTWKDVNLHSFLEELKSGKAQRLELSDIAGYIVEFSVDQHGSRFIQQKLETCTVEEKASVFKEVVPLASKLITDVFGNYVVQKLFDYGNPEQRMYLATQLEGQILPLSLQMYGCRVIQKALDVIELDQKVRLIRELDGQILRCVRDQNGNHVVQKCIESIPTDNIHFVISSFRGQVATLSMHPYGCRVIQRFLEHCSDDIHTQFIVDEILDSVYSLAQDQYGNYVTQHVLVRGKPHERSQIIEKLAGSVVQLSQHKFASNVVEKCLEYSDSTAREMLIKEIIGDGEKNDNLLVMMKDQYANYVIQRILDKCSSNHREILLGRIRNHLTALKKYTYGKHIVTRFEQLHGDGL